VALAWFFRVVKLIYLGISTLQQQKFAGTESVNLPQQNRMARASGEEMGKG
jgi:hypothetical protein